MKIAYLILAHNTPEHLKRLVRILNSPNSAFVVHVDGRSSMSSFRDGISESNVIFLENRSAVYWGEYSIVQATINLIQAALYGSKQPDYLALLSGSDYPLRSALYIEDFFSRNLGHQFINLVQMPCDVLGKPLHRLQNYCLQTPYNTRLVIRSVAFLNQLNSQRKVFQRDYSRTFKELVPYAGSQWWALTTEACRYILSFVNSRTDVVNFFRNTYSPDESFFHTIIGNSSYANNVTRSLTFTDWSRPSGGPAIIDMDHLKSFTKADRITADDRYGRGELLFARKFPDDSAQLTDFIDAELIAPSAQAFAPPVSAA